MINGDIPYIAYALVTPTKYITAHILDENQNILFLYAAAEYVAKTTYLTSYGYYLSFSWPGINVLYQDLPNGTYYLMLSVLKLLADPKNDTCWERWISPGIIIARPKIL